MANNVIIPATGSGDATPKVSTDQVSADSSQVQNVQQVSVSGGVITRNPTVPVSAASLPLPTGAALDATIGTTNTEIGGLTESAPGTDTASSGLNGRLQRIAQRLTTLIGLLPTSLGQKTMANSLGVTIASDQSAVAVSGTVTTTPPSNASTNLAQVAGASTAVGHGVAATALRVELPTDGTGIVGLAAGANTVGTVNLGTISTAATAAKQPAIGTAGTPSADVLSIQGVAGGTAIPVSGSFSGTTDTTASGSLTGTGSVTASSLNGAGTAIVSLTGTWSATNIIEVTVDGSTWITCPVLYSAISPTTMVGTGSASANDNYVVPMAGFVGIRLRCGAFVSGTIVVFIRVSVAEQTIRSTVVTGNTAVNINQVASSSIATGHGTASGSIRVELPTDGTGIVGLAAGANTIGALTANQSVNQAQVAGTAVDTNSGNKSAGTQRVVIATDQVQLTNALKVDGSGVTQPVSSELSTGLTTFSNTALSNTKTAVKAGAGKVYGWMIHNPSAATTFIQVWNVAIGSITVGTTAPTYVIAIPSGASANVFGERGITHSTEINIAATTTATGSSAPATACVVAMFYI